MDAASPSQKTGWVHSRFSAGWKVNIQQPTPTRPPTFPRRSNIKAWRLRHTHISWHDEMDRLPHNKKKYYCLGCNHLRIMIQLNILVHSDLLLRSNICRSRLLCLIFITCRAHCWSCLSLHVLYDICLNRNGLPCKTQNSYCSYWYCVHYWCVSVSLFKKCLPCSNIHHKILQVRQLSTPPPTPHPPQQKKTGNLKIMGFVDSAWSLSLLLLRRKGGKMDHPGEKKKHL